MSPDDARQQLKNALWSRLERDGISLTEIEGKLGSKKGWLFDRKRGSRFDVGEFWAVLIAAGINPYEFFLSVMGTSGIKAPEVPIDPKEDPILDLADQIWREGE